MVETHAPFWRQQEETAGQHHREISRLLPPILVRRALGKDFYAARQLPEMVKLLIIRLQSYGIKSCESEERTDGQPERG